MRLWHKDLLEVLPREQLVAAWREASAIAGAIQKNNTPNHVLVNYVLDYDYNHFISYCYFLRKEMRRRGYRTMERVWDKIVKLKPNYSIVPLPEIFKEIHNQRYLIQCYYNLQEKYDRGGIQQEDWNRISQVVEPYLSRGEQIND